MNMLGWNSWIFSVYDHVGGSKTHYMWATGYAFGHLDYNIMYSFESATPHGYSSTECVSSDAQAEATCLHNIHNAAVWVLKGSAFWADHQEGSAFHDDSGGARGITPGYNSLNAATSRGNMSANTAMFLV